MQLAGVGRWPEDALARGDGSGAAEPEWLGEDQPLHHHPPTNGRVRHTGGKGSCGERDGGGKRGQAGRRHDHEDVGGWFASSSVAATSADHATISHG
jgi:hypothetical protein